MDFAALPRSLDLRRGMASAAVGGLVLGVVTQLGQSVLPEGLGQLANSISPWLSVAFAVGAFQSRPRNAAAAGLIALAFALVGYYALVFVRFGYTGASSSLIFWTIGAVFGGLVVGPAGWFWRYGAKWTGTTGVAVLGGAWVVEAAYLAMVLSMREISLVYALIGLAVPLILRRTWRGRLLAWAAMLPIVALGGVAFGGAIAVQNLLAGAG